MKVTITGYETLPAGRMWLNQVWSGDMLNAVISYLPEGTSRDVLSYWFQQAGGPVFNDCICVGAEAEKPVMAHRFLNYMLDPKIALENFVGYVGYQPPITKIDADALFEQQVLPAEPAQLRRHARGLRQRQRLPVADGRRPPALGPELGRVPQR